MKKDASKNQYSGLFLSILTFELLQISFQPVQFLRRLLEIALTGGFLIGLERGIGILDEFSRSGILFLPFLLPLLSRFYLDSSFDFGFGGEA